MAAGSLNLNLSVLGALGGDVVLLRAVLGAEAGNWDLVTMQRTQEGGVIISCDFCGSDWDPYDRSCSRPMVEGHHGSVICLECVKLALEQMSPREGEFRCTLCIQEGLAADLPRWSHPNPKPSPGLNPHAFACRPCIRQAAGRFSKDKDVPWTWRPRAEIDAQTEP